MYEVLHFIKHRFLGDGAGDSGCIGIAGGVS